MVRGVPVDETFQFPAVVRSRIAANIRDDTTVEGGAVADVVAAVGDVRYGARSHSPDQFGKMIAFAFENSEMTARGYSLDGAAFTALPGVTPLANANATYGLRDPSIAWFLPSARMRWSRP